MLPSVVRGLNWLNSEKAIATNSNQEFLLDALLSTKEYARYPVNSTSDHPSPFGRIAVRGLADPVIHLVRSDSDGPAQPDKSR